MLIGGAKVAPAEADAIAAFFAGEAGKRWCELQCTAFPRTHERFLTFREEATGKHFLRWLGEPNDLVLPAAKYQEPGTGGR
jgi:hypothetical protein